MAAPSYTTDLTTYNDCTSTTGFAEATNMTSTDGSGTVDSDLAIHGTQCISEAQRKSGIGSLVYTGTAPTWTSGWCYFVWFKFFAPNSLDTLANGGIRVAIGSSSSNYRGYYVNGSNSYAYGGWINYAVDPQQTGLANQTQGSPTTTYNTVGIGANLINGISKGNSYTVDIIRYGRGESRFTNGDLANGYATFAGFAAVNDNATTGRWGLLQDVGGSYLFKGLMSLGLTGTPVDFRDSNATITIDNTTKVASTFNKIEINNASSNVVWAGVTISSLSTQSPGAFQMVANATVSMDSCTFSRMSTFIFQSNATVTSTNFLRCNQITHGGATMNSCIFSNYQGTANTSYVVYNVAVDPDGELDDATFVMGATATHGIELGTSSPLTMTFNGLSNSGYSATNDVNDSFFHVKRTSGTVTINIVGGTGNFSYRTDGATVVIVQDPVTTTITVRDALNNLITGARVYLEAADGTGPLPYLDSVTISSGATVATVTHTAHGLATNNWVNISGASTSSINGAKQITVTNANTYTFANTSNVGAVGGTITSTGVVINESTTGTGVVTDTRTFSSDQNVTGWVRKSSTSPYYRTSQLTGTIDNANGLSITSIMIKDE